MSALLARPGVVRLAERYGRAIALESAQLALDELRAGLREGTYTASGNAVGATDSSAGSAREALLERAEKIAARRARASTRSTLRRVVNATGVVVHTNLGRAPLARKAARAAARAAQGYVALEYDLQRGERGSRHVHCERLLREVAGAEAALVVNNCAAALLLALNTAAEGRVVIVSRGEMIEIGGGFRVYEILAKSGARLEEVGATNKTHLADYASALDRLGDAVGAILKVHRSNFVQSGFVGEVELPELAALARGHPSRPALVYDLGSGSLADVTAFGLAAEPRPQDGLAAGADLVAFSGDKLLGGPQAGVLVGSLQWIERAKANPLTRALRVDKLTLAALEATLALHRDPDRPERIPVLALLRRTPAQLRAAAEALQERLGRGNELGIEVVETQARVGGGSLPGAALAGAGLALRHQSLGPQDLERKLRMGKPPVVARVAGDRVILDLRSVLDEDLPRLERALRRLAGGDRRSSVP